MARAEQFNAEWRQASGCLLCLPQSAGRSSWLKIFVTPCLRAAERLHPTFRVADAAAKSCCKRTPAKALESQEKEKKEQRLEAPLQNCRHFTLFVCSVDGLLGQEAQTFAKCSAAKLANKWEKPCSRARTRQRSTEHRHSLRHAPARERKLSPSAQNQHPLSSVGRWSWSVII